MYIEIVMLLKLDLNIEQRRHHLNIVAAYDTYSFEALHMTVAIVNKPRRIKAVEAFDAAVK